MNHTKLPLRDQIAAYITANADKWINGFDYKPMPASCAAAADAIMDMLGATEQSFDSDYELTIDTAVSDLMTAFDQPTAEAVANEIERLLRAHFKAPKQAFDDAAVVRALDRYNGVEARIGQWDQDQIADMRAALEAALNGPRECRACGSTTCDGEC